MAIGTTRDATPTNTLQVKEKMEHLASKRKKMMLERKKEKVSKPTTSLLPGMLSTRFLRWRRKGHMARTCAGCRPSSGYTNGGGVPMVAIGVASGTLSGMLRRW
jgi:hypothetical protein